MIEVIYPEPRNVRKKQTEISKYRLEIYRRLKRTHPATVASVAASALARKRHGGAPVTLREKQIVGNAIKL